MTNTLLTTRITTTIPSATHKSPQTMTSSCQPDPVSQDPVSAQSLHLFHQVFTYPFSTDREFQQGLRAILDSASSSEQAETLTLDAQCFYYARCVVVPQSAAQAHRFPLTPWLMFRFRKHAIPPLDLDAYRIWLQSQPVDDAVTRSFTINSLSSQKSTITRNPSTEIPGNSNPPDTSTSNQAGAAPPPPPYPTSFSQIVDLITNGQPIPGIKDVPDTLLSGQESRAMTAKRKKPWERDGGDGNVDDLARRVALTQE